MDLTSDEYYRYDRQITLKGFDVDKQLLLKQASILIVGVGGLGTVCSLYLAGAGVGNITLLDFDDISISNLHRQILFDESSVGLKKAEQAKQVLEKHNSLVNVQAISHSLNEINTPEFFTQFDVIVDCTDNLETREEINRLCHHHKKTLISASAIRMEGMVTVFTYQDNTPCYHCLSHLFGSEKLTCIEAGVMAPLVGMMGSIQAMETIKVLTHYGSPLTSKLLLVDAMTMEFKSLSFPVFKQCPVCQQP